MSSSHRIRFNRSFFTTSPRKLAFADLVIQLAAEDIELIVDIRGDALDPPRQAEFDHVCEEAGIYYLASPELGVEDGGTAQLEARFAALAMRHRTCLVADDRSRRLTISAEIAEVAGQRVIDLEQLPARIALEQDLSAPPRSGL